MKDQDNTTQSSDDTVLSMVSTRLPTYQSSAQIQTTVSTMTHASIRLQARLIGPPGVCAGFFIYGNDANETDIELLTNDTTPLFHATNHPSLTPNNDVIPGASSTVLIPANGTANGTTNGSYTDWNDWRIDWLDNVTEWYVNGDLVESKTYSVPKLPAFFGINLWSQVSVSLDFFFFFLNFYQI
jgi:beta-glucanase (GH16 family)